MVTKTETYAFYISSIIFVCADLLFLYLHINFMAALLPLIVIIFYWTLFSIDKLLLLVAFCTPLSINITKIPGVSLGHVGVGMALPTEPIMFGIMLLFFLHIIYAWYDRKILLHPVSIMILLSLLWILATCFTSTMYFVSFKFLIERIWGVVAFYFLGVALFKKNKNIYYFNWLYISTLMIVVIYTLINESHFHFSEKYAHIAVWPFLNDHTIYGALLAMFIPILGGLCLIRKNSVPVRILSLFLLLLALVALGFSYCRAAWISVLVTLIVLILMLFKVKVKWVFVTFCIGIGVLLVFQNSIIMKLQRNHTDVSQNLDNEIQSISNISSDASNVERLNRWSCAYRMWLDKPVFGYGPGTYMFQYAPYQLSYLQTIISTNEANGGNAHSEYLGPLSEEGLLGMLTMLGIVASVFTLSFRLFYSLKDRDMRILVISIFLGLVTYFVHGLVNDFLDTDKAAVPFWGFIGMLVAIDINTREKDPDNMLKANGNKDILPATTR